MRLQLVPGTHSSWVRGIFSMTVLLSACTPAEPPPPPPPAIPVVAVIQRDQPIVLEMVGETLGSTDIPIRARVEGYLEGMFFEEGWPVKKDQLLYTIDPQPFEAAVVEAAGYLAEARTMLAKAKADLGRIRPLADMKAVSQQDLDGAVAQYEAAMGSVQAAEARLELAQIELGYTKIHSPIDGRIGISEAKVGEFVGRSPNPVILNYVSQADPIRVRFAIDERQYLRFARKFAALRGDVANIEALRAEREDRDDQLQLVLADGTVHEHTGRIVAYDAGVNPTTGTFRMEADFPNPDLIVVAGQFARVRGIVETREDAILVPQQTIQEQQGLFSVFVVGDGDAVELRPVVPGYKVDQLQVIESGLQAGDRVVFEGIQRLRDGMQISPTPVQLDAKGAPLEQTAAAGG
jgi:membrane fusion protein (multidrug efflux system)